MKIGIVGLGLIGGSLGLKLQSLDHTIYGIANNEFNEKKAKEKKLANFVSCDLSILKECELIILALPIKDLISPSQRLVASIPRGTIVTDVGSVKEPIVNKWEKLHPLFIGSHPMAGTEKKGVDSGFGDLFKQAKWIITPTQNSDLNALKTISDLIKSMDCEICQASPKEHDEAVSLISHLPIFLASALIETAHTKNNQSLLGLTQKLAATGFADTSRVGGGNEQLGLDLAMNNQINVLNSINNFKNKLNTLEALIKEKNWELLSKKLSGTKEIRKNFID
ncbi:arogenate dehydrogenase [Prochlorococcus marinus str. MU1404]|uniref:prephenate/arogenate dehydrogenase n=1 Tax=Prochlorococcus marinus TaxID=1219 RepID=UPI001ADB9C99|nr:prephenate/arogenate dehydrogenase [Prochlorococcus marinus]MBO8230864.1 prephenate/arogenate dehydrogenase [Prochlorococcus marinus XMU1404]MBW3073897.1 arogenate dehydrogenase [Prochlorococcus marinus str. MU1404]MCR8544804.1 prephenate/arogenate dehydrogenase [Prochlorococcus marinus CUG1432]